MDSRSSSKSLTDQNEKLALTLLRPEAMYMQTGSPTSPLLFLIVTLECCSRISALVSGIDKKISVYLLSAEAAINQGCRTIEGMASWITQIIRAVQPSGPYSLAGYLSGGPLAYEVCAYLTGEDQEVSFLGLLEPSFHETGEARSLAIDPTIESPLSSVSIEGDHKSSDLHLTDKIGRSSWPTVSIDTIGINNQSLIIDSSNEDPTASILRKGITLSSFYLSALTQYSPQRISTAVNVFTDRRDGLRLSLSGLDIRQSEFHTHIIPIPEQRDESNDTLVTYSLGKLLSTEMWRLFSCPPALPERAYHPSICLQGSRHQKHLLFCVPGAGASVTNFVDLAAHFDETWMIHGLQPRGFDGMLSPHSSISATVLSYLRSIDQISADKPIHLMGHSFGGWVVFEMAISLLQLGRQVGSLVVLDSMGPDVSLKSTREATVTDVSMKWIENLELTLNRSLGVARTNVQSLDGPNQRVFLHSLLVKERLLSKSMPPDVLLGPLRTFAAALRMPYVPTSIYPQNMQLVLADHPKLDAKSNLQMHRDTIEAWKKWAPDLTSVHASGNHITMLKEPNAKFVFRLLRQSGKI